MYRIPLHRTWPQCWWTPSATSSTLWSGAAPAPAGTQRNHWTDRLASPSHSASQQARQGSEKSGLKGTRNKKAKNAPRNNLPGVKKWLSCLAWCPLLPPPPLLHYSHPKGIRGQSFSVGKKKRVKAIVGPTTGDRQAGPTSHLMLAGRYSFFHIPHSWAF